VDELVKLLAIHPFQSLHANRAFAFKRKKGTGTINNPK
jgi:hypothetical protein